jgi:hypothetical protein
MKKRKLGRLFFVPLDKVCQSGYNCNKAKKKRTGRFMRRHFSSYVPEMLFSDRKQESPARICREDFTVLDPTNKYKILAGRGLYTQAGLSFLRLWQIPTTEIEWMEGVLPRHRRVLLDGKDGPVLVFADLLQTTGLLFAVRPYLSVNLLVSGLRQLNLKNVVISPGLEASCSMTVPDESRLTQISELFYYMDRILDAEDRFEIGVWTRTRLIATFAGCKLESVDLPITEPTASRTERDRLTAFLICTLLEMRKMDGKIAALGEGTAPTFRCRLELTPLGRLSPRIKDYKSLFPALEVPVFRDFSVQREEDRLVLDAYFSTPGDGGELHAELPFYWHWRMVFCEA